MVFKNGVKNIQAAAYNGAHTVVGFRWADRPAWNSTTLKYCSAWKLRTTVATTRKHCFEFSRIMICTMVQCRISSTHPIY